VSMNKVVPDEEDPLLKHYRYTRTEKVFDRLDVGGNGSISFAEYLTQVDNLEQDEIQAARAAFELLGPDINGDVKKRKFIALQISSFEDVAEPEFNRWVHIMTKGSVVHSHKRKDLLASGIQVSLYNAIQFLLYLIFCRFLMIMWNRETTDYSQLFPGSPLALLHLSITILHWSKNDDKKLHIKNHLEQETIT